MARVFISYAHADAEFARYVTRCLRAAKHEPWLDEENISAGKNLEEALEEAVGHVDCGVFLIGWDWVRSLYSRKEIQLFTHRDKAGEAIRRIGILRAPRADLETKLPSQLSFFVTDEWIDGVTDPDEAAWRLHCAVSNTKPGPREDWKRLGRAFTDGPPPEPLVPVTDARSASAAVTGNQRPSLYCDRGPEWNRVEMLYAEPMHHLLLIAGPQSEAHEYFVARIDHHLKKEPPHDRVRVDWPLRPVSAESFQERIAAALGCGTADLVPVLRRRLAHRNLILIHPPVSDQFDDEDLVSYYGRWLPELLMKVEPANRLKSIQPVAWTDARGLGKWLGLGTAEQKAAEAFIVAVRAKLDEAQTRVVMAARIDLGPIGEEHVQTFCEDKGLSGYEREQLLKQIQKRKRPTSRDILSDIDDFMRRRAAGGR